MRKMGRILGLSVALCAVLAASSAKAEKENNDFYVSLKGGYSWDQIRYRLEGDPANKYRYLKDGKGVFAGSAGVYLPLGFRTELEYSIRDISDSVPIPGADVEAKARTQTLLLNLAYEFPAGMLRPYAGIGIGGYRTDIRVYVAGLGDLPGNREEGFAAAAFLGLAVPLTDMLALDVGGKVTYLDIESGGLLIDGMAGLRFSF